MSTFIVDWKARIKDLRDAGAGAVSEKAAKAVNRKRVLVVEDNLDAARALAMLVADMGHATECATRGSSALALAKRFKPDVVLLDIGLPDVDGFDVCSQLKADPETMHVRVIVITGYAQDEYRIRAKAAGCDVHLIKPASTRVLEELLD